MNHSAQNLLALLHAQEQPFVGDVQGSKGYKDNKKKNRRYKKGACLLIGFITFHKFETDDNFIILVPEGGDRMIKVVNEGQSFILEAPATDSVDRTMEYEVINKFGISIMPTSQFGYIKFEA